MVECRKEGNRPDYHLPHLKSAPRGMPQKVPKLTILITCASGCSPICRGVIFASLSIDGAPFGVLGGPRIQSLIDGPGIRLREMSNFCCLRGRAGGTPIMV